MNQALGNRYRLGERIAAGGMGSVYRAVDETLGRRVAVKLLRRALADDPTFLERFRREARAAATVSHPGVAGVYDYGELGGQPFIVMELVEGETLAERIAARGRLPWPEAFAVAEQVARALAAAHAHGLVHRDVKPANILLGADGRAKVTDFGIAKAAQAATLTGTGMVLGSASYVAPEQAQGGDVGPAADQYSLGCVLFEAVTGEPPYRGASAVAIASQHVSAPVPDPRHTAPDLPAPVADLIRRALDKEPDRRFASAAAMADAIAATLAGDGRVGAATAVAATAGPAAAATPATVPLPATPATVPSPATPVPGATAPLPAVPLAARARRPGWRALVLGTLVAIALLLLAWLPRSGLFDPPAGQRSRPTSPTAGPAAGVPSTPTQGPADGQGDKGKKDKGGDRGGDESKGDD
jgi:eukaryotic-like serine/threonine-protein kinase